MSVVSTLVFVSQALRKLAIKVKGKAIAAIGLRIKKVEAEQVKLEEHRSKLMTACHTRYYESKAQATTDYNKALAELEAKFNAKLDGLDKEFSENKGMIAITSQAASNQLKSELAALRSELDHLTK